MKIKKGGTRIVLIFSNYVVKIPRPKLFRPIKRLLFHVKEKDCKEALLIFDKRGVIFGSVYYLLSGFIANYTELNFYKNHKDMELLVPVKGILFGLVLIQKRVREISEDEYPEWSVFLKNFLTKHFLDDKQDLCVSRNFGIDNGKIKLLDYGKRLTVQCLEKIYL